MPRCLDGLNSAIALVIVLQLLSMFMVLRSCCLLTNKLSINDMKQMLQIANTWGLALKATDWVMILFFKQKAHGPQCAHMNPMVKEIYFLPN